MEVKQLGWIFFLIPLFGFTQIYQNHDNTEKTDTEFTNIYSQSQSNQFKVILATPSLADLKDGEIVIVSSGTYQKIMFRQNQEIYSINVSCVTIRR